MKIDNRILNILGVLMIGLPIFAVFVLFFINIYKEVGLVNFLQGVGILSIFSGWILLSTWFITR
jgi:hypothetical protein